MKRWFRRGKVGTGATVRADAQEVKITPGSSGRSLLESPLGDKIMTEEDLTSDPGWKTHYMIVVLRDDQLERIADAVAEKLRDA